MPVGADYKLILSNNVNYSSAFPGALFETYPNHGVFQPAYAKVDLGMTLLAPDDRWEIALLGKNITDKIVGGSCSSANLSSSILLPSITG